MEGADTEGAATPRNPRPHSHGVRSTPCCCARPSSSQRRRPVVLRRLRPDVGPHPRRHLDLGRGRGRIPQRARRSRRIGRRQQRRRAPRPPLSAPGDRRTLWGAQARVAQIRQGQVRVHSPPTRDWRQRATCAPAAARGLQWHASTRPRANRALSRTPAAVCSLTCAARTRARRLQGGAAARRRARATGA